MISILLPAKFGCSAASAVGDAEKASIAKAAGQSRPMADNSVFMDSSVTDIRRKARV
jgi:hypothetical protein